MSFAEDMGFDDFSLSDLTDYSYWEGKWRNGYHEDREGKQYKLAEMTYYHLINTIKYFEDADTTPLEIELKRRNKIK